MSILEHNGAAIVAMAGKNCVAIASDTRFGLRQQTVTCDFEKVFKMSDKIYVGLAGLATDVQTLRATLKFKLALYKLREERKMKPEAFAALLSHMLYEKRFGPYFVEPLVAGLKEDGTPFLCGMDLIGAPVFTNDFVVSGTCASNLNGLCESFFRPDMEPDDLFETISQCLLASVDRDALSGWGAIVHVITPQGVTSKRLKARMD
uniref:Proteasome subunit beta n=1 Tax=Aureoumbra lagunensis TaxID=44058 RepID=A0A7S3K6H9_9STRA|mmetsp:Transcript_3466/g.4852  ORF Transcript_3466/g.4852 Transcript_3466/m.4852 type:complete len:205 (+) Transcript_3466:66-680(+)